MGVRQASSIQESVRPDLIQWSASVGASVGWVGHLECQEGKHSERGMTEKKANPSASSLTSSLVGPGTGWRPGGGCGGKALSHS